MKSRFIKMLSQTPTVYIWLMLVFATATSVLDVRVAVLEFIITIVLLIPYIINKTVESNNLKQYLESLTYSLDAVKGADVNDFQLPVCVINQNGVILWNNKKFTRLAGTNIDDNISICEYIPEFDLNTINGKDGKITCDIKHGSKYYHIFGSASPDSLDNTGGYFITLYWLDRTELEVLKTRYNDEAFVSCILLIDNFDDLMQETPLTERSKLQSAIEEKIVDFAKDSNGILKKYDKDKYFFYFQKSLLKTYIENKFSVLDSVREINLGNKIPATLSLGIGLDGESFAANDENCFSALDMALGRGGDQVVVKTNDRFDFYGGQSKEIEKHIRVKARVIAHAIRELINEYDDIYVMGHKRADIDVLGASMGLYRAAQNMGKSLNIIIDRSNQTVERYYSNLDDNLKEIFISKSEAIESVTKKSLLFIVDTHKVSLVEAPELLEITKNIVIIDHHRRSTDFIQNQLLIYHEPYASSTSELVTEVLQYMTSDVNLKQVEAEALYAGIYMDTKAFTFKTGVRTFEAASFLRRVGVDTVAVKKLFQTDASALQKRWTIIDNAQIYKRTIAIASCAKCDNDMQTIVAQATDELLNITDITSAFVVCDMGDGNVVISARSLGNINVQVIMEKLGGGGHMTIAGAQLTDVEPERVETVLRAAIDEYLLQSAK